MSGSVEMLTLRSSKSFGIFDESFLYNKYWFLFELIDAGKLESIPSWLWQNDNTRAGGEEGRNGDPGQ